MQALHNGAEGEIPARVLTLLHEPKVRDAKIRKQGPKEGKNEKIREFNMSKFRYIHQYAQALFKISQTSFRPQENLHSLSILLKHTRLHFEGETTFFHSISKKTSRWHRHVLPWVTSATLKTPEEGVLIDIFPIFKKNHEDDFDKWHTGHQVLLGHLRILYSWSATSETPRVESVIQSFPDF